MNFSGKLSEIPETSEVKDVEGSKISKESNEKYEKIMGDDKIEDGIPNQQDSHKLDLSERKSKYNRLFDMEDSEKKDVQKTEQNSEKSEGMSEKEENYERNNQNSDCGDGSTDNYEKSVSNQDDLKDLSPELRETKPEHSPALDRWIEEGGQIRIKVTDGKPEWTYINAEGIEVKYDEDGYPIFPDEVKHPYIPDINIGSFTGDREKDKRLYLKELEKYGLTDIPEGYVLHHDSKNGNLQLIKKEYHEQFTHKGGHSKYKEGAD